MTKPKRDALELNHFQLRVLKPFYVAALSAAIFFAAMVYAILFFPDQFSTTTIFLTQCEAPITFPVVSAVIFSVILSVGAFLLANRMNTPSDKSILPSLVAGVAMLFSVSLFVLIVFQKFIVTHLKPTAHFLNIAPHQLIVVIGGLIVIALMIGLFYWAYGISNKVLGPYDRILRDLDQVVEGKLRADLYVRPGDEMFGELISRINILIKRQKEQKDDRQSDGI